MRLHIPLTLILLLLPLSAAAAKDDITKELITLNGKTRAYYLYVPSNIKSPPLPPLIILLHGSNRTGISLVEKWKDYAKKEGIILAGPDSADSRVWSHQLDGPDFLHDLVEELKNKYPINPRRVYLFGHSGGAIFAMQMALMESQYFAAAAIHAGALTNEDKGLFDLAKRKIPVSIQVGDSDPLFPVNIVRATRDAFKAKGFPVDMVEIPNHNHWYYDQASKFNQTAWQFLKQYELDADPFFQKYHWN